MPRSIILSAFAIASIAIPAQAADLPARSRLGAVFAEPAEAGVVVERTAETPVVAYTPDLVLRPLPGYYGKPNSFAYSPYYGSSSGEWAFRLPYACHYYGYC
jgi:hypothetical protein